MSNCLICDILSRDLLCWQCLRARITSFENHGNALIQSPPSLYKDTADVSFRTSSRHKRSHQFWQTPAITAIISNQPHTLLPFYLSTSVTFHLGARFHSLKDHISIDKIVVPGIVVKQHRTTKDSVGARYIPCSEYITHLQSITLHLFINSSIHSNPFLSISMSADFNGETRSH